MSSDDDTPGEPPPGQLIISEALDDEWVGVNPIRLGDMTLTAPLRFVTMADAPLADGTSRSSRLRLDLHDVDEYKFNVEAVSWNDFVVVGYGQRVYLVSRAKPRAVVLIRLGTDALDYFIGFYPLKTALLVRSGQKVLSLTPSARISWATIVGVDGVEIDSVEKGVIAGRSCTDPPDLWEPFRLSLDTGLRLK